MKNRYPFWGIRNGENLFLIQALPHAEGSQWIEEVFFQTVPV
jgi:hypothetical protein